MLKDKILVLDFGSQYTQLIARRVRENRVYSEIFPYNAPFEKILDFKPKGIILSGGPSSVYSKGSPIPDIKIFNLGIPILGICYGMQLMAHLLGGRVAKAAKREYGRAELMVDDDSDLFNGIPPHPPLIKGGSRRGGELSIIVWMSHGDRIEKYPKGFMPIAHTENSPVAAMADKRETFMRCSFIRRLPIQRKAGR